MNPPNSPPPFPIPDTMTGNFEQAMRWMQQLWGSGAGPAGALGAQGAAMLRPEEFERRIGELRSVERWLDLHLSMIRTTIQTMEMQRSALAAWQAMSASAGSAAGMAGGGASGATAGFPGGAGVPRAEGAGDPAAVFQPNAWWNAMQEQFQRLASAAANPPPVSPPASASPGDGPAGASAARKKTGPGA